MNFALAFFIYLHTQNVTRIHIILMVQLETTLFSQQDKKKQILTNKLHCLSTQTKK